ncbi:short-chain dehydrogenase [Loigolactobacillus backii]|nr:short-chain dehydrogenase [Loigolactobacillus backii]
MMKKALATGANKGIGFEIAKQLGNNGYFVLVGARNVQRGKAAVERLLASGLAADQVELLPLDIANATSRKQARDVIQAKHADLSLLVNNAGAAGDMKPALETSAAEIQSLLDVNLFGTFEFTKLMVPILEANNGRIADITGPFEAALQFSPAAYSISKVALNASILNLAANFENKKMALEIFGIFPGGVTTDLNDNRKSSFMKSAEQAGKEITALLLDKEKHNGEILTTNKKVIGQLQRLN